jgi:hypothetical protein
MSALIPTIQHEMACLAASLLHFTISTLILALQQRPGAWNSANLISYHITDSNILSYYHPVVICFINRVSINMLSNYHKWSSSQSSWLQIQRSGFDSRRYHIFWEVAGPERGPLSLVSTIEELLERQNSGSGLENWECGRGPFCNIFPQKVGTNFAD